MSASPTRVLQAVIGVVVVAVASLVAFAATPSATTASGDVRPTGETTSVAVTVDGMSFVPSRIEVPAGNELVITFTNTGDQPHDLVLANGVESGRLAMGAAATLDVGVIGSDLSGWCSISGHRAMGMTLDIVAVGGAAAAPPADHDHDAPGADGAPTMAQLMQEAKDSPAAPAELPPLTDQTLREYTFTVTEGTQQVTADVTRQLWTYNGTAPGPVLHGRVGDTFRITLVNDGSMGHSIDFHAGEVAPDEPMRTLAPGESLVYEFTATRSGVWMYHCGTMPMSEHIANGLFGAVIIEPDGLDPVDASFVLIQSDAVLGDSQLVTFNGRAFQYAAHPLAAVAGERVRMWVLDAGPDASLSFHVVGVQFDTVWTEGAYSVRHSQSATPGTEGATGAQVLPLMAAQGGFVEFVPPAAGNYTFVNHQMSLAERGAQGVLTVSPAP